MSLATGFVCLCVVVAICQPGSPQASQGETPQIAVFTLLLNMWCRQEEDVANVVDDTVARFGTLNTFVSPDLATDDRNLASSCGWAACCEVSQLCELLCREHAVCDA